MKVTPVAYNHIHMELDNGEILDVNDGTSATDGAVLIKLSHPTDRFLVVRENNEEYIRIELPLTRSKL